MRISHVRVWVDDMAAARRFYGDTLGLRMAWSWGEASMGFAVGGQQLIVEPDDGSHEEVFAGRDTGCTIAVEDIDATYADWTAKGVAFDGPPEDAPGIGVMTSFKDPAGNTFTLYADRPAARRRTAPPPLDARAAAAPGAEAAVRRMIDEFKRGEPDYALMSPGLAEATRRQLTAIKAMFRGLGALESVSFHAADPSGADVFEVALEEGSVLFQMRLDEAGKTAAAAVRPKPGA